MRDAGFTLLELMVAVALLGLVAMVLSGGMRFGARAWERSADLAARAERIAAVQAVLRRQLERAYPLADDTKPTRPVAFAGSAERIDFRAAGPERLGLGALRPVALAREDGILTLTGAESGSRLRREPLLDEVAGLRIDYYGTRDRREPREWRSSWDGASFLPGLIRIEVAFRDASRHWPTLVIAPAITVDSLLD